MIKIDGVFFETMVKLKKYVSIFILLLIMYVIKNRDIYYTKYICMISEIHNSQYKENGENNRVRNSNQNYENEYNDSEIRDGADMNKENVLEDIKDFEKRVVLAEGFYREQLSEQLKEYITGKSYKENDMISYDDLQHVVVKYIDFNGNSCSGELIVNVIVADDVLEIFKELYDAGYQIEKIRLVDEYDADDDRSMADNNTCAFNYRVIDGTEVISDHGYGVAIDINPLYNPYVRTTFGDRNILPVNGAAYADRLAEFEHKIVKGDICYNTFIKYGFKWGGEWDSPVDYQHFYKEIEK